MVGFPVACNLASVMNSFFGSSCVFSFLFLEKGDFSPSQKSSERTAFEKDKNDY